jgi:hypothetical protein
VNWSEHGIDIFGEVISRVGVGQLSKPLCYNRFKPWCHTSTMNTTTEYRVARIRCGTVGSTKFDPEDFFDTWPNISPLLKDQPFQRFITQAFKLKIPDTYVYHAVASVTLVQVQAAIDAGDANGLHDWYQDDNGHRVSAP